MKNEEFKNPSNDNNATNELNSLGINKVSKSICKITSHNGKSTGFLVSLPINMGDRYLYGLLTTNLIFSENWMNPDESLNIYFPHLKQSFNYMIPKNAFLFTCPFLDISFIEIPLGIFKNVEYLRVCEEPLLDQKLYYLKESEENNISFIEGNITEFYGTNICYKIDEKIKDNPSPGLPIISLSKFSLGDVIGVSNDSSFDYNNEIKMATHLNIIIESIKSLVKNNIKRPLETLSPAKELIYSESLLLNKIGLEKTENPFVFISPASFMVTPLWFYRTQYAWFWTPKKPENFSLKEIKKCNWSIIKSNKPIIAIGGIYDNNAPALRNINLIKYLIDSGLKFLVSIKI